MSWSTCIPELLLKVVGLAAERDQPGLRIVRHRHVPVGRSVLPDQTTSVTLADRELLAKVSDRITSTSRAQKFSFCKSFNIEMSNACSATIRFNRAFSCSSVFNRIASSSFNAPNFERHR